MGAVVETPKLLKLLMEEDGKGLEGADGVSEIRTRQDLVVSQIKE